MHRVRITSRTNLGSSNTGCCNWCEMGMSPWQEGNGARAAKDSFDPMLPQSSAAKRRARLCGCGASGTLTSNPKKLRTNKNKKKKMMKRKQHMKTSNRWQHKKKQNKNKKSKWKRNQEQEGRQGEEQEEDRIGIGIETIYMFGRKEGLGGITKLFPISLSASRTHFSFVGLLLVFLSFSLLSC